MMNLRSKEKGQVMLLGILVLVALVLAVFILFDVQNLIRGKVKAQTAADAAALTGAEWQKNTLNVAGELNLISAATVLISDDLFGIGEDAGKFLNPEKEKQIQQNKERLKETCNLISQLQYRNLFLTPLIGFGAAQAAAKNNGINYYQAFCDAMKEQNDMLAGNSERSILYDKFKSEDYCRAHLYGFRWYTPYLATLNSILQEGQNGQATGIAAMPNGEMIGAPSIYTDPPDDPDFSSYLSCWEFYESVQANDWCALIEFLEDMEKFSARHSSGKWWGNLKVNQNQSFENESEYLPVRVQISQAESSILARALLFSETNDLLKKGSRNLQTFDTGENAYKLNPFPQIQWAYYKSDWAGYGDDFLREWYTYLKGSFKQEAAYFSGAVARMDLLHAPGTFFASVNSNQTFAEGLSGFSSSNAQSSLARMNSMEHAMKNSPPTVWNNALAKPFGVLSAGRNKLPPYVSGIVLPVFDKVSLIPVSLEDPGSNPLAWYHWYLFKLKYLPVLGTVNSLSDMPEDLVQEFSDFHAILKKADRAEWRASGQRWLDRPVSWDKDGNVTALQRDRCPYCSCTRNTSCNTLIPRNKH